MEIKEIKERKEELLLASVFSFRVFIPLLLVLLSALLVPVIIWYIFSSGDAFDIIGGIVFFLLLLLIVTVMFWGELRLKAVRIRFTATAVELTPFLGWGKKRSWPYQEIDGYMTGLEPAYPVPNERIVLISHKKEVVQLSRFYFQNYGAMKQFVQDKFEDLGQKPFSMRKAVREIFGE